jgi:hypothetical protein
MVGVPCPTRGHGALSTNAPIPGTGAERLLDYLLDGATDGSLGDELHAWLSRSPRFREFAGAHRDKIRKKLRSARDGEALRDVRAELRAAELLLGDRRMDLAFEAFGSTKGGPDFTVTFRGERPFNCEVTRLRRAPAQVTDGGPLLAKLRQLPPSMPNLLVIAIDATSAAALDIETAVLGIRRRADDKDEPFFERRGFAGTRDFYARFLRLSGTVAWCEGAKAGDARASLWANPSARIPLPDRAARACLACLRDAG